MSEKRKYTEEEIEALASGFGGMGHTRHTCGAVNGGMLVIGTIDCRDLILPFEGCEGKASRSVSDATVPYNTLSKTRGAFPGVFAVPRPLSTRRFPPNVPKST